MPKTPNAKSRYDTINNLNKDRKKRDIHNRIMSALQKLLRLVAVATVGLCQESEIEERNASDPSFAPIEH